MLVAKHNCGLNENQLDFLTLYNLKYFVKKIILLNNYSFCELHFTGIACDKKISYQDKKPA